MNLKQPTRSLTFVEQYQHLVRGVEAERGVREYDANPYAVTKREAQRDRGNVRLMTYLELDWLKHEEPKTRAAMAERSGLKGTCC